MHEVARKRRIVKLCMIIHHDVCVNTFANGGGEHCTGYWAAEAVLKNTPTGVVWCKSRHETRCVLAVSSIRLDKAGCNKLNVIYTTTTTCCYIHSIGPYRIASIGNITLYGTARVQALASATILGRYLDTSRSSVYSYEYFPCHCYVVAVDRYNA